MARFRERADASTCSSISIHLPQVYTGSLCILTVIRSILQSAVHFECCQRAMSAGYAVATVEAAQDATLCRTVLCATTLAARAAERTARVHAPPASASFPTLRTLYVSNKARGNLFFKLSLKMQKF